MTCNGGSPENGRRPEATDVKISAGVLPVAVTGRFPTE